MALQNNKAELVDLTQEGPSKNEPPITITLNDSVQQPEHQPEILHQQHPQHHSLRRRDINDHNIHLNHHHHQHHHHHRYQRQLNNRIEVVDVIDSEEEEDESDLGEPARKRQNISTSSTPRRKPLTISPASHHKQPRPDSPDNSLKCPICIETFKNIKQQGTKCVVTRCGHLFCDSCLKKALTQNGRKCPKCRKNVPKGPTAVIEVYDLC